ncbi:MAG: hypothetical protein AAF772_06710, partial [Acidobacteriota bacterium]
MPRLPAMSVATMSYATHHQDRVESRSGDLFLERIPEPIYADLVEELRRRYGFLNGPSDGGSMRIAEYFVGLRRTAADTFDRLVRAILHGAQAGRFPRLPLPEGFQPPDANLPPFDRARGIPFGYFDAAVTEDGLRIIEVQSNVTYAVTAAFIGRFLQTSLSSSDLRVFVHDPETSWQDFVDLNRAIIADGETEGIVIADRDLDQQKTRFELYATQRELDVGIDVVDTRWIREQAGGLWYPSEAGAPTSKKVRRLYHRTLAMEAMEEDGYPHRADRWGFRFDRAYADMIHVNHPGKNFEISKHIQPYLAHALNPPCFELSEIAAHLRRGEIGYGDFVWKHKLGVAGRGLFLQPDRDVLDTLDRNDQLHDYIAQSRVDFERFRTGDGSEKIVELRFMSVQSADRLCVVPMARIGHVQGHANGGVTTHIHFGENNAPGYG